MRNKTCIHEQICTKAYVDDEWIRVDAKDCTWESCEFDDLLLDGCQFVRCVFTDCKFSNTTIAQIDFSECTFNGCTFGDGIEFIESRFERCTFQNETKWMNTDFSGSVLVDCDLSKSVLDECWFDDVVLGGANTFPPTDILIDDLHSFHIIHIKHNFVRVGCKGNTVDEWERLFQGQKERFIRLISPRTGDWTFFQTHFEYLKEFARECPKEVV